MTPPSREVLSETGKLGIGETATILEKMRMVVEDPYQFVEKLDERTVEYAEKNTRKFKAKFGKSDGAVEKMAEAYNKTKMMLHAQIRGDSVLAIYSEGDSYRVSLDGNEIYSTPNVIQWTEASEDLHRIAVFESPGSDKGTLRILKDGKMVLTEDGNITQLKFTDTSYYIVKTFSDSPPPDGGEINSHRVLHGDRVVFGAGLKPSEFIHLFSSGTKIMITVGDWNQSAIYSGNLDDPTTWERAFEMDSPAKPLCIRQGEVCYLERKGSGVIRRGSRTLVEAKDAIEDCVVVKHGFLALHLKDARILPVLYDFEGRQLQSYAFDAPMGLRSAESDENSAAINLQSFGIPYALYLFSEGRMRRHEENRLLDLKIEDRYADSAGANIHYFLVSSGHRSHRKAVAYGYGGYDVSLTPRYSPLFALLLENGIAVAQANLRGGGEYGEEWHRAGIREKKQAVFDDFIAVIQQLKKSDYRVVAMGESNGGLLVGSVLTQRPGLLKGAILGVPVLDMMRFHLMSVGKYWTTEYGDPDNPGDARYLAEYSPYNNIRKARYPMVLLYSRLKDDRVHPAHAIKFHMKLSRVSGKAYLRINPDGGHAGISAKQKTVETCENFNFISSCLGDTRSTKRQGQA